MSVMRPSSIREHLRQLGQQSAIYGLGLATTQGLGFLLLPIVTRYLPPDEYGIAAVMTSLGIVLGFFFTMGVDSAALRHYYSYSDDEARRRYLGALFVFVTGLDLILSVMILAFNAELAKAIFGEGSYGDYLNIVAWSTLFRVGGLLPLAVLRTRQRPGLFALYSVGSAVVSRGCMVLLVIVWRHDAVAYLVGILAGNVVVYPVFVSFMLRESSPSIIGSVPAVRRALTFGAPLVPHQISHWVLGAIDRLMLQRLVSFEAAGLYGAGYAVGMIMGLAAQGLNHAWNPFLYRLYAEDAESADAAASRLITHYTAFITLVALLVSLLSPELVRLMVAPAYVSSRRIVPLVVAGYWMHALYYIPVSYLFLSERTKALPLLTAFAAAANIAANLVLIPGLGIMGPAWAKVLAYALLAAAVAVYGQRVRPYPCQWGRLARICFSGLGVGILGEWVARQALPYGLSVTIRLGLVPLFGALLLGLGAYRLREVVRLIVRLRRSS